MGMEYSEVSWQETSSWQEPSLFATFSHLQEQVERLVGPLFERRSQKDRRRSVRDLFGRRETDRLFMPRQDRAS